MRAVFIAFMLAWLDHRRKHRQRRYDAENESIERFEKRMNAACEVDAEMLEARDLSPEHWDKAIKHYRRRLDSRQRRNALRGTDLDYFANEPLARARQRHRVGGHARGDHPGGRADDLGIRSAATAPAHDCPVRRSRCPHHPGPDPARLDQHRQTPDGVG